MSSSSDVSAAHSRAANQAKRHGLNSPEYLAARRDLNAALIKKRARELVANAPRLTDSQVEEVVRILRRPSSLVASLGSDPSESKSLH